MAAVVAVPDKLDNFQLAAPSSARGRGLVPGWGLVLEVGVDGEDVAAGREGLGCTNDMVVADFVVVADGFDVRYR